MKMQPGSESVSGKDTVPLGVNVGLIAGIVVALAGFIGMIIYYV